MNIDDLVHGSIQLKNDSIINKGDKYSFTPSETYADVSEGVVEVTSFIRKEDICCLEEGKHIDSIIDRMNMYIDKSLLFKDTSKEYIELEDRLMDSHWVVFTSEDKSSFGVLPLDDFASHIHSI